MAGAGCALAGASSVLRGPISKCFREGSGQIPVGTKAGFPWGALSPKPAGLLSQVCGCSVPKRAKEGGSPSPLPGQPERPRGSRSPVLPCCPPTPTALHPCLAPLRPLATAREARRPEHSSAWPALTLAAGRHQAGGESQQQRARRRRPALHPADGPRRSFPGRWARVAHCSSAFAGERSLRPAPPRAPRSRKLARPGRPVFLPAPVPTLQTEHKAL